MKNIKRFLVLIAFVVIGLGMSGSANAQIIISEIYGGGGNSGATFNADFIELYNQGGTPVNLTGYTLYYKPATGATFSVANSVALTGTIPAMGYFLVQASTPGTNGAALPTPDQSVNIGLAAPNGNVLLTNPMFASTAPFACPAPGAVGVSDRVGYGTGDCPEVTAAPAGSNSTSVSRATPPVDTNNNSVDFTAGTPTPQASGTTAAEGTITGRARTENGRGIKHAVIMLTGGNLESPIYATTNQFGYYQFEDVGVGQSYVLQINSGRYSFQNSSRVINLGDSLTDEDFIADTPATGSGRSSDSKTGTEGRKISN